MLQAIYCLVELGKGEVINTVNISGSKRDGGEAAGEWFCSNNDYVRRVAFAIPDEIQRFRTGILRTVTPNRPFAGDASDELSQFPSFRGRGSKQITSLTGKADPTVELGFVSRRTKYDYIWPYKIVTVDQGPQLRMFLKKVPKLL